MCVNRGKPLYQTCVGVKATVICFPFSSECLQEIWNTVTVKLVLIIKGNAYKQENNVYWYLRDVKHHEGKFDFYKKKKRKKRNVSKQSNGGLKHMEVHKLYVDLWWPSRWYFLPDLCLFASGYKTNVSTDRETLWDLGKKGLQRRVLPKVMDVTLYRPVTQSNNFQTRMECLPYRILITQEWNN